MMKFSLLETDAKKPIRKNKTDAGLDLFSLEDVIIPPFENRICRTGVSIQVPENKMLLLLPKGRSNYLIGSGVIDPFYEPGEILVRVFNTSAKDLEINKGDAICQAVYIDIYIPEEMVEAGKEELKNNNNRSDSGSIKSFVGG